MKTITLPTFQEYAQKRGFNFYGEKTPKHLKEYEKIYDSYNEEITFLKANFNTN